MRSSVLVVVTSVTTGLLTIVYCWPGKSGFSGAAIVCVPYSVSVTTVVPFIRVMVLLIVVTPFQMGTVSVRMTSCVRTTGLLAVIT
jgi:hypothetical protein